MITRKNDAFVAKIVNTRLTKTFMAISVPDEKLPSSATLPIIHILKSVHLTIRIWFSWTTFLDLKQKFTFLKQAVDSFVFFSVDTNSTVIFTSLTNRMFVKRFWRGLERFIYVCKRFWRASQILFSLKRVQWFKSSMFTFPITIFKHERECMRAVDSCGE